MTAPKITDPRYWPGDYEAPVTFRPRPGQPAPDEPVLLDDGHFTAGRLEQHGYPVAAEPEPPLTNDEIRRLRALLRDRT